MILKPPLLMQHDWQGKARLPASTDRTWTYFIEVYPKFTYLHCEPDTTIWRITAPVAQDTYQAMCKQHPNQPVALLATCAGGTAYLDSVRMPDPMPIKEQPAWRPWG